MSLLEGDNTLLNTKSIMPKRYQSSIQNLPKIGLKVKKNKIKNNKWLTRKENDEDYWSEGDDDSSQFDV